MYSYYPSGTIPLLVDRVIDKPSLRLLLLTRCSGSWTMPSPQVSGQTGRGRSPGRPSAAWSRCRSNLRTRLDSAERVEMLDPRHSVYPCGAEKPFYTDVLIAVC